MKRNEIIKTIHVRTSEAYKALMDMQEKYGVDSLPTNEARAAWHELYKLCQDIGLNWKE